MMRPVMPGHSLEIAAPTATIDPLAPWIGARTSSERALAATFLAAIGGLSSLLHATLVIFALIATLLPIPFLSESCSTVRPVVVRPPERVVVSIVEVKPVLEEVPPPPPETAQLEVARRTADAAKATKAKGGKTKKAVSTIDGMNMGVLALLSASSPSGGVLGSLDDAGDAAVFGALLGDEIGDSFGVGGLGLSGVGVAGGGLGDGAVGLGSIGTIGQGGGGATARGFGTGAGTLHHDHAAGVRLEIVDTELDRAAARRALLRKLPALASCTAELPLDITLRVTGGKVTRAEGAPPCVARALANLPMPGSGYVAVHLEVR